MIIEDKNFDVAFKKVLRQEGGYVNDPIDRGGETNFGISRRSYPNEDIKNMTLERAREIYYRDYWLRNKCNIINRLDLAEKLFSLSVNVGCVKAGQLFQRAIRCCTGKNIDDDGIIGTNTLGAMELAKADNLFFAFKSEAAGYYRCIVERDSSQLKFLKGWLNRAYS